MSRYRRNARLADIVSLAWAEPEEIAEAGARPDLDSKDIVECAKVCCWELGSFEGVKRADFWKKALGGCVCNPNLSLADLAIILAAVGFPATPELGLYEPMKLLGLWHFQNEIVSGKLPREVRSYFINNGARLLKALNPTYWSTELEKTARRCAMSEGIILCWDRRCRELEAYHDQMGYDKAPLKRLVLADPYLLELARKVMRDWELERLANIDVLKDPGKLLR